MERAHLNRRPTGDDGLAPYASGSSMSAASRIQKPPMCSLVSRNGPSVMNMLVSGDSTLGMGATEIGAAIRFTLSWLVAGLVCDTFESGSDQIINRQAACT